MPNDNPEMAQWQQRLRKAQRRYELASQGNDTALQASALEQLRHVQTRRPSATTPTTPATVAQPKRRQGVLSRLISGLQGNP